MQILRENLPKNQKLSVLLIEQAVHHKIQLTTIDSLYKLSISVTKPVIVTIHGLHLIKHIMTDKKFLQLMLRLTQLISLSIIAPGYGIFHQKAELEYLKNFLQIINDNSGQNQNLKTFILELPGWKSITLPVITSIVSFIKSCPNLNQLRLNFNFCVDLKECEKEKITNGGIDEFYGNWEFDTGSFEALLNVLAKILKDRRVMILELKFNGWVGLNKQMLLILIDFISSLKTHDHLQEFNLDLKGWGDSPQNFDKSIIKKFVTQLNELHFLHNFNLDIRNWHKDYKKFLNAQQIRQNLRFYSQKKDKIDFALSGSKFYKSLKQSGTGQSASIFKMANQEFKNTVNIYKGNGNKLKAIILE